MRYAHVVVIIIGRIADIAAIEIVHLLHHLVVVVKLFPFTAHVLLAVTLLEFAFVHAERRVTVQVGRGLVLRFLVGCRLVAVITLVAAQHRRVLARVFVQGLALLVSSSRALRALCSTELGRNLGQVLEGPEDGVDEVVDMREVQVDLGERIRQDDGEVLLKHELGQKHRSLRVRAPDIRKRPSGQEPVAEVGEARQASIPSLSRLVRSHGIAEGARDGVEDRLANKVDVVRKVLVARVADGGGGRIVTKTDDDE